MNKLITLMLQQRLDFYKSWITSRVLCDSKEGKYTHTHTHTHRGVFMQHTVTEIEIPVDYYGASKLTLI